MTMDILSYFMILGLLPCVALEFTCTREGRLKNPEDPSCRSYYLCRKLRNGTYISKLYQCPASTLFNPEIGLCSMDYTPEPTPPDDFQCTERGRFPDPNDDNCKKYFLCTLLRNGSFIRTAYTCPKSTYFDPALQKCSVDYQCSVMTTTETPMEFVCSTKGRFKDPEDLSCTVYYLCSQLRNGTFIKSKYKCPLNTYFDPDLGKCSNGYICIGDTSVSTTDESTSTYNTISTTDDNYSDVISSSSDSTDIDIDTSTAFTINTVNLDNNNTSTNDADLSSITDGDALSSSSSNEDDNLSSTSSDDDDTTNTSSDYTTINYSDSIITENDDITHTSSNTFITSSSNDYDDTASSSSESTMFDGIISTASSVPASTPMEEFTCTEKGRFEDVEDVTCKTYFLCSDLRNGTFIKTKYVCPKNSRFDPGAGVCSAFYTCPRSTTQAGGTTKKYCGRLRKGPRYGKAVAIKCVEKGRFRDPDDNACEFYYLCSQLHSGAFVSTKYRCPEGTNFDPELGRCSAVYVCLRGTTTPAEFEDCEDAGDDDYTEETGRTKRSNETTLHTDGDEEDGGDGSTTTVAGGTPSGGEDDFVCPDKGRFPDVTDPNCERYFLCSRLLDGTFIKTKYKCPDETYFDPILGKCSPVYKCWDLTTNSFENSDSEETSDVGGYLGTTLDLDNFVCRQEGRYSDPEDNSCRRYFLCSQFHNGTFIGTKFQCPIDTLFDPVLQTCSPDYQCPYVTTVEYSSSELSIEDELIFSDDFSLLTTRFGNPSPSEKSSTDVTKQLSNDEGVNISTVITHPSTERQENSESTLPEDLDPLSTLTTNADDNKTESILLTSISTENNEDLRTDEDNENSHHTINVDSTSITTNYDDIFNKTKTASDEYLLSTEINNYTGSDVDVTHYTIDFDSTLHTTNDSESHLLTTEGINGSSYTSIEEEIISTGLDTTTVVYLNTPTTEQTASTDINENASSKSSDKDLSFQTTNFDNLNTTYNPENINNTLISSSSDDTVINTIITEAAMESHSTEMTESECQSLHYTLPNYEFKCEQTGRFADPNDPTMKQYFLCSKLRNGTFMQNLFQCPHDTFFVPTISKCSSSKTTTICPTSNKQTTIPTEVFVCLEEGRFPNPSDTTNSQYYECILMEDGTFNTSKHACPDDFIFDPLDQVCYPKFETSTNYRTKRSDDDYSSTDIAITTNNDVIIGHTVGGYFTCKARGYYKNYDDPTGVSYYYCDIASDGRLFQYLLKCPDSYFYNTENNLCTPIKTELLT